MSRLTAIRSNANQFVKGLSKVQREYNLDILKGIAAVGDNARQLSVSRYMIQGRRYGKRVYDPAKLTIRSGMLANALRGGGVWDIKARKAELIGTEYLKFWVRPQVTISQNTFSYYANFAITESGNRFMRYRLQHNDGAGRTRQGGPRKKRPFFTSAIYDAFKEMDKTMIQHMKSGWNAKL